MNARKPWGIVSIRISAEDRATLESALELAAGDEDTPHTRRYYWRRPSLSDFIRDAALERAKRLLERRKTAAELEARKTKPAAAPAAPRGRKTTAAAGVSARKTARARARA